MTALKWLLQGMAVTFAFLAVAFWLAVAYAFLFARPVYAHDWYPYSCCSSQDCFEVPASNVEATPGGWRIKNIDEVVPYDRTRQTPAEGGGHFHRCTIGGNPNLSTLGATWGEKTCFWAPAMEG